MLTQHNKPSRRALLTGITALLLPAGLLASENEITLRGRLDPQSVRASTSADQPLSFLTTEGKKFEVVGDSMSNAQLRDPLLLERDWELVGSMRPDGRFGIVKLFTIKDGKRYRVTYYCEICHIVTHEPGLCMCCQGPTELQEIPSQ